MAASTNVGLNKQYLHIECNAIKPYKGSNIY